VLGLKFNVEFHLVILRHNLKFVGLVLKNIILLPYTVIFKNLWIGTRNGCTVPRHIWYWTAWILWLQLQTLLGHGSTYTFFCTVLFFAGTGLSAGWPPVQGILPNVWKTQCFRMNSE